MKKVISRALLGFPIGVFVTCLISLIISLIIGEGNYFAASPQIIEVYKGELNAVILQFGLSGILGSIYAAASLIWDIDNWSILKQTVTHFWVISLGLLPIAYLLYWMEHSLKGILVYFGVFISMYIFIWMSLYISYKIKIKNINSSLK